MKKSFLTALIFLIAIGSISAMHRKTKKTKNIAGNKIESVTMSSGACFGRCPIYTVEVNKNGMIKYTGIRFVKDSGIYEKNIGTAAAMKLFQEFNFYRVDTCKDAYDNKIPDLAGIFYKIQYTGRVKNILNAHFGPEFLKALSVSVDSLAKVDGSWKNITSTAK